MNIFRKKEIVAKGELNKTPFNIIQGSDILTKEDFEMLAPLAGELQESFKKSQVFRTRTEMEVSVLNDTKHPTPSSKYWQAMKEQNVMFGELVMSSYEYRKKLVEIKKIQRDIPLEKYELEKELKQIELEKEMFLLKNQERTAKDRIRELKAWSEIKERESKLMDKGELGEVDNHQLVSYTKRWINQSILMGGNGSPAERQNLLGQLRSGILLCIEKGIMENVLDGFSKEIQDKIREEYNLTKK